MIKNLFLVILLPLIGMGAYPSKKNTANYFGAVDPYIGTGGHVHVFLGASVPFGAVQLDPNNIFKGWDWCSDYHYSDSIVTGFSHSDRPKSDI